MERDHSNMPSLEYRKKITRRIFLGATITSVATRSTEQIFDDEYNISKLGNFWRDRKLLVAIGIVQGLKYAFLKGIELDYEKKYGNKQESLLDIDTANEDMNYIPSEEHTLFQNQTTQPIRPEDT